jgi:HPt (histidine-containing phosphotransfer) domain-containing protein
LRAARSTIFSQRAVNPAAIDFGRKMAVYAATRSDAAMSGENGITFSMPGGEAGKPEAGRPIDMAHLSRQTMGDRALEQEVLALFLQQATGVSKKIADVDVRDRLLMAHGLKGSARGVGAFAIADCATAIEHDPNDALVWKRLDGLVEEVSDFVAAIAR